MAKFGQVFDASEVPTLDTFDPIPAGQYLALITESEMKATKAGDGQYLKLVFEVVDGDYKGRKVWAQLNLDNPNPTAVQIAMRELSSICHAAGKLRVEDSEELHNVPMLIKVKIEQQAGRDPQNRITSWDAANGQGAPAPSTTSAPKGPAATTPPPGRPAQSPFASRPAGATPAAAASTQRAWGRGA